MHENCFKLNPFTPSLLQERVTSSFMLRKENCKNTHFLTMYDEMSIMFFFFTIKIQKGMMGKMLKWQLLMKRPF